MDQNVNVAIDRVLGCCEAKKVIFPTQSAYAVTRELSVSRLVKDSKKLIVLLAFVHQKDGNKLVEFPYCVGTPVDGDPTGIELIKNSKSKQIVGWTKHFGAKATTYTYTPYYLPGDGPVQTNQIIGTDGLCFPLFSEVVDGPYALRVAPPPKNKNLTGWGYCDHFLMSFCGKNLKSGFARSSMCLEQGGEPSKMMTEGYRGSSALGFKFVDGNLGPAAVRCSKLLGAVGGDRDGGRHELQQVIGARISELQSIEGGGSASLWSEAELISFKNVVGKGELMLTGIGSTKEEKGHTFSVKVIGGEFQVRDDGYAYQPDDTNIIRLAGESAKLGLHSVINGNDTDLWLIGCLYISNLYFENANVDTSTIGKLFVRRGKVLDENPKLVCVNDFVEGILAHDSLQFMEPRLRVPTVVFVSIACGGDTTSAIPGYSHSKALENYLKHAKWIGNLVNDDSESACGHHLVVNEDAFQKFMHLAALYKRPSIFVPINFIGMSCSDRERKLDALDPETVRKMVARNYLMDMCHYLQNQENLRFTRFRGQTRLNRWNNSKDADPGPFENKGIEVHLKDGSVLNNPFDSEMPESEKIRKVMPMVMRDEQGRPTNSSFIELFGTTDPTPFFMQQAALNEQTNEQVAAQQTNGTISDDERLTVDPEDEYDVHGFRAMLIPAPPVIGVDPVTVIDACSDAENARDALNA